MFFFLSPDQVFVLGKSPGLKSATSLGAQVTFVEMFPVLRGLVCLPLYQIYIYSL